MHTHTAHTHMYYINRSRGDDEIRVRPWPPSLPPQYACVNMFFSLSSVLPESMHDTRVNHVQLDHIWLNCWRQPWSRSRTHNFQYCSTSLLILRAATRHQWQVKNEWKRADHRIDLASVGNRCEATVSLTYPQFQYVYSPMCVWVSKRLFSESLRKIMLHSLEWERCHWICHCFATVSQEWQAILTTQPPTPEQAFHVIIRTIVVVVVRK